MVWNQKFIDTVHRYLRIPYGLHVKEFRSPKKPKATIVFIHGIGNTLHAWDDVVAKLPRDVRLIGIDLLGFGKSPKPGWATYNAKTQARSVARTLIELRLKQRPMIVGHSLGALVAVEVAKRYPLFIKELVLCSPPLYQPETAEGVLIRPADDRLRSLYRLAKKYPERIERMSKLAVKLGVANRALNITQDNIPSYFAALESSIINQTSLKDISALKLPVMIFYGALDPVIVGKHITRLSKEMSNFTVKKILAGHEVMGVYSKIVSDYINKVI